MCSVGTRRGEEEEGGCGRGVRGGDIHMVHKGDVLEGGTQKKEDVFYGSGLSLVPPLSCYEAHNMALALALNHQLAIQWEV